MKTKIFLAGIVGAAIGYLICGLVEKNRKIKELKSNMSGRFVSGDWTDKSKPYSAPVTKPVVVKRSNISYGY